MNSIEIKKFIKLCIKKKVKINIAESCTGGLVCSKIVSEPNASKVLECGVVTYSNLSKHNLLGISKNILSLHGAVSAQTAYYMAKQLSNNKNINFSIAITGIAGPLGGTKNKPVGLVFFSFCLKNKSITVEKKIFSGNRNQIREKAANYSIVRATKIILSSI